MRTLRRVHLYLGCFFAPMLLFYILTGWYQTLNPNRLKSPGEAETLVQKFRVIHTDQIYPTEHEFTKPSSPKLYQALVVVMAAAATATIVLGIILAFQTLRNKWPVWISFGLGLLLPVILLWLGQKK